jgi:hypothetical protein
MPLANRISRVRDCLCTMAFAVAPFTSAIVGHSMIGHSLALALCQSSGRNHDTPARRLTGPSRPVLDGARRNRLESKRNFLLPSVSDSQDGRE